MHKLLRLYGYELKNAYGYMVKCIIAIISVAVIGAVLVYGYINSLSADSGNSIMTLGVVFNDESDDIFPMLVEFANDISSLKGFCRLEIFDEEEAFDKLEKDEIQMMMLIPEGFMDAAEHMQEAEIILYTRGELTSAQYKILGLFHGVEGIMLNTEGSIKSMYLGMEEYSFTCSRNEMEYRLMELFVADLLGRENYFKTENVSAYGDYSAIQHYLIAVILIITAFTGIPYLGMYNKQQKRVEIIMSCKPIYRVMTAVVKIICSAFPLITEMWIMLLAGKFLVYKLEIVGAYVETEAFVVTAMVGFSMAVIINLISVLIDRQAERVTAYMLIIVMLSLLSGVISSIYYLPDFLRKIVTIWPMHNWQQVIMGALFGSVKAKSVAVAVAETVIMGIAGIVLYSARLSRHE